MAVWEYQVDYGVSLGGAPKASEFRQHLNKRGEEGWELGTVIPVETADGKQIWLVFKRPIPAKRVR